MIRSWCAVVVLGALLALFPGVAQGDLPGATSASQLSVDELLHRVRTAHRGTRSIALDFAQRWYDTKAQRGRVLVDDRGRMSWRYDQTGVRVIRIDQRVTIYEKENDQRYDMPAEGSLHALALALVLRNGPKLKAFELRGEHQDGSGRVFQLQAEPSQPARCCERLFFRVDATTYRLRRAELISSHGTRLRFDFLRYQLNAPTPDSEFVPPASVKPIVHYR